MSGVIGSGTVLLFLVADGVEVFRSYVVGLGSGEIHLDKRSGPAEQLGLSSF